MIRLSIPGNKCGCGVIIGKSLICPGCGHVDPQTYSARREGGAATRTQGNPLGGENENHSQ